MSSSTRRGKTSSKRFRAAILASAEAIRCLSVKGSCEDIVRLFPEDWTRRVKVVVVERKSEEDGSSKKENNRKKFNNAGMLAAYLSVLLDMVIRVRCSFSVFRLVI